MLGEALTPKFGQTFGTFVRSEGPRVALYNRAVVCENYSVITVSLVSQSSAISLSVEMRIPNPKYKGRTRKIPQLRTQPLHVQPYIFASFFRTRKVVYKDCRMLLTNLIENSDSDVELL